MRAINNKSAGKASVLFGALAAAALMGASPVQAQSATPYYAEVGYAPVKVTVPGLKVKPEMVRGILGQDLHRFLGAELMLGTSLRDERVDTGQEVFDVKVKYHYGFYLKPKLDISPQLEIFGRLGYGRTKVADEGEGLARSDVSYGLGAGLSLTRTTVVKLDYMRYHDKEGVTVRGYTLGLGVKF